MWGLLLCIKKCCMYSVADAWKYVNVLVRVE